MPMLALDLLFVFLLVSRPLSVLWPIASSGPLPAFETLLLVLCILPPDVT